MPFPLDNRGIRHLGPKRPARIDEEPSTRTATHASRILLDQPCVDGHSQGCTDPKPITSKTAMWQAVRQQLTAESPDSDAAVILKEALKKAESTGPDEQAKILDHAPQQAAGTLGSSRPLWRRRSRKAGPAVSAGSDTHQVLPGRPRCLGARCWPGNRQFMTLFHHIQDRQIAMTGPVVMGYPAEARQGPEAPSRSLPTPWPSCTGGSIRTPEGSLARWKWRTKGRCWLCRSA